MRHCAGHYARRISRQPTAPGILPAHPTEVFLVLAVFLIPGLIAAFVIGCTVAFAPVRKETDS